MGYIDVSQEVATFFLSLLLGAFICFLYDLVRALHKLFLKGFLEVLVTDILFWAVASVLTFSFMILRCMGNIRGFVLFGILLGFLAVRFTASRYIYSIYLFVFLKFNHFYIFFSRKIHFVLGKIIYFMKKYIIVIKKLLQDNILLLYNQLKRKIKREGDRKSGSAD